MERPAVHIIGAGLAGLAAAVGLAGGRYSVVLHEAARQAGGRCRSYYDSALGTAIDNGNHLLLSGNWAALEYLAKIGGKDQLAGPHQAEFAFADLASGERWLLRPNAGPVPWWIFSKGRRVPDTRPVDYLEALRLLMPRKDTSLGKVMRRRGPGWERLWRPFFLAALNTEPEAASCRLAAAVVRETLARGGLACKPLIAAQGLSRAFIDPALAYLGKHGVAIHFDHRLKAIEFDKGRACALDFGGGVERLGGASKVILAVPPYAATQLLPGMAMPQAYRAIVNAHFKIDQPVNLPPLLGIINGTAEWIFAFRDRLSATISGADGLIDVPREKLAAMIWHDISKLLHMTMPLPPWQIIKEKRATFAATVEENVRRPGAKTCFSNLLLAGDWTATGLPATVEGAIRSGFRAAELV
jgi:squalene-associated FAD-dependent desaturase